MSKAFWLGLVGAAIVVLGGCGAGSVAPDGADQVAPVKIIEYRGDGGGSLKPPALFLAGPEPAPASVGELLGMGATGLLGTVPRKATSWYYIAPRDTAGTVVVTLQPTANEDSDLFVLDRYDYHLLKASLRTPSYGDPDSLRSGYAPDWVAVDLTASSGWPLAYVAVYGAVTSASVDRFRLEADGATVRGPGSGTWAGRVAKNQSKWCRLNVHSGDPYNLTLTAVSGDPDIFVYHETSSKWVGSDVSVGGGSLGFTAGAGPYYIRIFGSTGSDFSLYIQDV